MRRDDKSKRGNMLELITLLEKLANTPDYCNDQIRHLVNQNIKLKKAFAANNAASLNNPIRQQESYADEVRVVNVVINSVRID
jgi:hypothetical protein